MKYMPLRLNWKSIQKRLPRSIQPQVYAVSIGVLLACSFIAFTAGKSVGYDEGYDDGYSYGYDYGYDEGYDVGFGEGREEGYDVGYDAGYNDGYDDGYSEGHGDGYRKGYNCANGSILLYSFGCYRPFP